VLGRALNVKVMAEVEFRTIEPKILYFGTPVALISSLNEAGASIVILGVGMDVYVRTVGRDEDSGQFRTTS
jgi:hypothetical protein